MYSTFLTKLTNQLRLGQYCRLVDNLCVQNFQIYKIYFPLLTFLLFLLKSAGLSETNMKLIFVWKCQKLKVELIIFVVFNKFLLCH